MEWVQVYDPLGNAWLSTLAAALPIVLLLGTLAVLEWSAHWAALAGLVVSAAVSVVVYGMPVRGRGSDGRLRRAYGLFPIGWIILNAVFLYNLTVATGQFEIVKASVARLSADRRMQALLIAFSFGAFIEGAAGFGTPVAISAALLMGLGFTPLYAAGLSLIANTAPVAFGAIGTPILTLGAVTGISPDLLSAMAGRQLPFVSLIVPAWLVVTMSGWRGLRGAWPAVLVCGGSFAIVQFLWSNYVGPELVDIVGGLVSLGGLALFCTWWKPAEDMGLPAARLAPCRPPLQTTRAIAAGRARARVDAVGVSVGVRDRLGRSPRSRRSSTADRPARRSIARSTSRRRRMPCSRQPSKCRGCTAWSSATTRSKSTPSIAAGCTTRPTRPNARRPRASTSTGSRRPARRFCSPRSRRRSSCAFRRSSCARTAGATLARMRWPLLTIAFMLSLGFVTRYGGTDATLGLAFTKTGWLYPFFAAMLGWLGVALTGSDTSSNVLFGSLQKITAQQLGLDPILITTANSTGGVMGKMIDAQSIVVATAATNQHGQEGRDPAVRLLAQRRARGDHGDHRDAAGVRVSVDGAGSLRHDGRDGERGEDLTTETRSARGRTERTSLLEGISLGAPRLRGG